MLDDRDDPILDVCLEETLGGKRPPDLSARILAAWRNSQQQHADAQRSRAPIAANGKHQPGSGAPVTPGAAPLPIPLGARPAVAPSPGVIQRSSATSFWHSAWLPLALAASLLLAVGGFWFVRQGGGGPDADQPVAEQEGAPANQNNVADQSNVAEATQTNLPPKHSANQHDDGARDRDDQGGRKLPGAMKPGTTMPGTTMPGTMNSRQALAGQAPAVEKAARGGAAKNLSPRNESPRDHAVADGESVAAGKTPTEDPPADPPKAADPPSESAEPVVASASPLTAVSASATSDAEIIAFINRSLRARWQEAGVRPSPPATDAEWCRRVFLDLIGRIPTIDELEAFLVDNARDKRARLVDQLLNDDDYVEAYARHWTTLWTTTLVGRNGGMEPNSPVNREGLQQFLRRSFLSNKPYDRFVYELISAQGSNRPGEPDFNGAVNFVLDNLQEKAATATAKTAQIFLGVQIQCTQCHNHPFNEWKQNRFWELNAFFRQARAVPERQGNELQLVRLVDEDFAGEGARPDPDEAEIYYELRNGIMQSAYPAFIDGTEIGRSGFVSEVDRREELARLVVRADEFGQAIVNRMWAHAFGQGFTRPFDDLGEHNPPSHPELLGRLGREFSAHGHDLKRLLRWITLSEPYSLSSKFGSKFGNAADDPTLGEPPLFSHFYLRQMTAEQLYDSLLTATDAAATKGGYEQQQRTKDEWLKQFAIAFGTDENDEATTFDGTITQALMMMNGELTRQATSIEADGFLGRLARQEGKASQINQLYLAALGRRPSRAELQLANGLLAARGGDAATVLEDVWWALLNSNEFILNH